MTGWEFIGAFALGAVVTFLGMMYWAFFGPATPWSDRC